MLFGPVRAEFGTPGESELTEEATVNRYMTSAACKNEVLVPTSATVPAAATKKHQQNDDDD